jgi:hypothetical protein
MNVKSLKTNLDWRETGIIKGVKVRQIPIVGNGAEQPSGTDRYGYIITEVSDDGTEFKFASKRCDGTYVDAGRARLITRKNSRVRGRYGIVNEQTGKLEAQLCTHSWFGLIYPLASKGCAEDYLDPSF